MKKQFAMILLAILVLALAACGENGDAQYTPLTQDDTSAISSLTEQNLFTESPYEATDEAAEPQQQESRDAPDYIIIRGKQFSTALTELDLNGMGLVDEEIAPLRYMTNLRILFLGETQFISNQISDEHVKAKTKIYGYHAIKYLQILI